MSDTGAAGSGDRDQAPEQSTNERPWSAGPPFDAEVPDDRGKGLMRGLVAVAVLVTLLWLAILVLG